MSNTRTVHCNSNYNKEEYNNIPVHYCAQCHSLKILTVSDFDYCDECGSTHIEETHIDKWLELKDK